MDEPKASGRRELILFVVGAAAPALAIAAFFHLHPWPTPLKAQADLFNWVQTGTYLVIGALGALAATRSGATPTPAVGARSLWVRLVIVSLTIGFVYGACDIALGRLTPWDAHTDAQARAQGITWVNVGLPWSLLHYAHGSILSECAFRLGAILLPTWLVSHVLLRDRFKALTFWGFSALAAFIEPIEKAIFVRGWSLTSMSPLETLMTLEGCLWQFAFAFLLRRYGWSAPIIARYGYYLLVRILFGYLESPHAIGYPGPH